MPSAPPLNGLRLIVSRLWAPRAPAPHYANQRSRPLAIVLSLAMLVLFAGALIEMGWIDLDRGPSGQGAHLVSVNLDKGEKAAAKPKAQAAHQQHASLAAAPQHTIEPPRIPVATPSPAFIHISHSDFAASDIGKMARHPSDSDDNSEQSGGSYGPGEGPGGAHLYNAAWYREPSNAELRPYLNRGAPPGSWGVIACRTVEHYHVEDCRELDESPPGSGIARALRQASFQFLVRPPRRDGQAMIGAWVRIRFDFLKSGKSVESDEPDTPQ